MSIITRPACGRQRVSSIFAAARVYRARDRMRYVYAAGRVRHPRDIRAKEARAASEGYAVELFEPGKHSGLEEMLRGLNNPLWERRLPRRLRTACRVSSTAHEGKAAASPVRLFARRTDAVTSRASAFIPGMKGMAWERCCFSSCARRSEASELSICRCIPGAESRDSHL